MKAQMTAEFQGVLGKTTSLSDSEWDVLMDGIIDSLKDDPAHSRELYEAAYGKVQTWKN